MIRLRSVLAHGLAALLLVLWGGAPAQCVSMLAMGQGGMVLCVAPDGTIGDAGGTTPHAMMADCACPGCHALGSIALLPTPPGLTLRVTWSVAAGLAAPPAELPALPWVSPVQARAPPALG